MKIAKSVFILSLNACCTCTCSVLKISIISLFVRLIFMLDIVNTIYNIQIFIPSRVNISTFISHFGGLGPNFLIWAYFAKNLTICNNFIDDVN